MKQRGISPDEYEEIIYDSLFSLIDDLFVLLDNPTTICIDNEDTVLFMHDTTLYHKTEGVKQLLTDNYIPIIKLLAQSLNLIEHLWPKLKAQLLYKVP